MEYTNEALADLIVKIDPEADYWVYNRHCESCGKFLYPESISAEQCAKCKADVKNPVETPQPFLTSATAFEKFVVWLKRQDNSELLSLIDEAYSRWLKSDKGAESYKEEILAVCLHRLS